MAQVTVKINGYSYTIGCEDGQEAHLIAMAGQVENRIDGIKALGSSSGESRLLAIAALMIADELHDVRAEADNMRTMIAGSGTLKGGRSKGDDKASGEPKETARKVSKLAARAEQIANGLDQP